MNGVMSFFKVTGGLVSLLLETLYWCKSALGNTDKISDQLLVIGYQTLPVGALIALFSGGVLALQAGPTLAGLGIEENVGGLLGYKITPEKKTLRILFIPVNISTKESEEIPEGAGGG